MEGWLILAHVTLRLKVYEPGFGKKQIAINLGNSAGHRGIVKLLGSTKSLLLPDFSFLIVRQEAHQVSCER